MKRIFYSSGSVVTGDRMAQAVVHYAEVLATRDTSDTIDIPIALGKGNVGRAQMLIGPASQLVVVPEMGIAEQPEDDATINDLNLRSARLGNPRPLASDDGDNTDYADSSGFAEAADTPAEL